MFLTHALRAIFRAAVVTGDSLWKFVTLLISGTPPAVTFISDASTNGNVLTLNGDTRPSNFNPYTPGYYSNFFDGTGDAISAPASTTTNFETSNFTIEAWVYLTAGGSFRRIYSLYGSAGATQVFLRIETANTIRFYTIPNVVDYTSTVTLTLNTWNHIAVVRNGSAFTTYLNGVSVASATSSAAMPTTTTLPSFISGLDASSELWLGYISNLRVVKGTAVYTAAFTPPTAPLTAISGTSLLTCQSNRLIDNSLNNFVITKNGDTTVSGFTPFTPPTSVNVNTLYSTYFDGTGDNLSIANNAAFNFGTSAFTVEAWVYFSSVSAAQAIITNYGSSTTGWAIQISGGVYIVNLSGDGADITGSAAVANTWTHVAVSGSFGSIKLFVNGTQQGSTFTGAVALDTSAALTIGSLLALNYVTGYISNVRIVKGTAVYTANFTPPTSNLTAITNTSLLTCQNATLIDNSTNAFAITSVGQAQPVAQSPFTQTTTAVNTTYLGSGYFDGNDYISGSGTFAFGSSDFCIEAWGYWTSFNNGTYGAPIISIGRASPTAQITLRANKTAAITTTANYYSVDNGVFIPSAGFSSGVSAGTINLNTWTHFALTRQGSTFRMFINGVLTSTQTDATAFGTAFTLINIGSDTTPSSGYMTGWVTNARVVVGSAIYTASFAPPAQPLTAVTNTRLLTLQTDQPVANKQFVDNSGNNFPITQVGNATQGTFSPYGANWSNYFDGTGDYLTAPTNTAFSLTGNFTIECWLYPTAFTNYKGIWSGTNAINATGFHFGLNAAGNIFIYSNGGFSVTSSNAMTLNAWNHVAVVRNSGVIYIYINGVLSTNSWTTSASFTNAACVIGTNPGPGTEYYFGYISNFRLVNGTAVYTANFTPPTAPLTPIAGTSLLTCQDNRFVDDSPNNFTITRAGDVSVQRFSPFSPVIQTPTTYSTFFDGTGDYLSTPVGLNTAMGNGFAGNIITIENWIYPTSFPSTNAYSNGLIGAYAAVSANGRWWFGIRGSVGTTGNLIFVWTTSTSGEANVISTSNSVILNQWNHVAVTINATNSTNTTINMFVNGILVNTFTGNNFSTQTAYYTSPSIGGNYSIYVNNYVGYISNFRIVTGTAVYTANFTPPTAPLTAIANTSLLTCQSATHIDNSTNAFTITQAGDATPRLFNPFGFTNTTTGTAFTPALYAGSAYFDGTGDYLATPATGQFVATGDFTIQFSFYLTSLAATNHLIGNYTAAVATDWILEVINTGVMQVFLDGSTQRLGHSGITVGQWYHVSITRSGTTVTGRINGAPFNTTPTYTMSGTFGTATKAIFMGMRGGSTNPLFGYLTDVSLVNGTALYKGSFVPPLAPMTAVAGTTLLLNMDKGAAVDSSRNVDMETLGDAKVTYETPYAGSYYSNYFDGTGDFLSIPDSTAFTMGSGDFTIECWINLSTLSGSQMVIGTADAPGNQGSMSFVLNVNSGTPRIGVGYGNAVYYATAASTITANTWVHLAGVRNGASVYIYVNGVQSTALNMASLAINDSTQIVAVGRNGNYNGEYVTGYISNVRIVKGTAVYTAAFTPPTAPLTAVSGTSLLTCQSKSFVDNSSNAFAITRNGDVAVKSQNPFQKNTYSSMFFDGTGDYLHIPQNELLNPGTGQFTIEMWLNPTTTVATAGFYAAQSSGSDSRLATQYYNATGLGISRASGWIAYTSTVPATGSWTHIAFTRDSSNAIRIFFNGVAQTLNGGAGTTITDASGFLTTPMRVGEWSGAVFNGYIADLRITKGSARYTANFTPPTAPLPTS